MFGVDDLIAFTGVAGGLAIGGQLLASFAKGIDGKTYGELATSQFGEIENLKGLIGNDGIKLSKGIQLNSKASCEGINIIGSTGSGKSAGIYVPNLLNEYLEGSIIVNDSKRELYKLTSKWQQSQGRKVIVFSPLEPFNSAKYNPLERCKDTTQVIELAQMLLVNGTKSMQMITGRSGGDDPTWLNMSQSLLCASLLYCKSKGKPLNTITNAIRLIINHDIEELETLFSNSDEEIKEQYNIFKTCIDSPKTASSIKITLASALQLFTDKKIEEVTSKTDFTGEDFRKQRICLYINIPEVKSHYTSPLMSILIRQLIEELMDFEGNNIYFMLDEFATSCGYIIGFSEICAVCRSRKISMMIALQSQSQLEQLYGVYNSKSILNNLKVKCILPSISDINTLNYVSELTGDTQITLKNSSISDNKTSISYHEAKKKLMDSSEIRRLESDEILIIAHNRQPIKDKQNLYYLNPEYTARIKK